MLDTCKRLESVESRTADSIVGIVHGLFSLYRALVGRRLLDTVGAWTVNTAEVAARGTVGRAAGLTLNRDLQRATADVRT